MEKAIPWLGRVNLWLLLAAAVWFRTTSLEAIPEVHGDEAWYGLQVGHMLRGEPFATRTFSGNPLNPFFSGLMVPLHNHMLRRTTGKAVLIDRSSTAAISRPIIVPWDSWF